MVALKNTWAIGFREPKAPLYTCPYLRQVLIRNCRNSYTVELGSKFWIINARQSPACSPPGANTPAKLTVYWTVVHQILIRRRGIIGGVNACIYVAILPSVVECRRTEWRWGMPIFADSRQKLVTMATSRVRSRKEGRIVMSACIHYIPIRNLLKIGPIDYEIIMVSKSTVKNKESNIGISVCLCRAG